MTGKIIISILDTIPLWVMISPILICSLISLAVIIERSVFYRLIKNNYRLITNHIISLLKKNKIDEAKLFCEKYNGKIIIMISNIINSWGMVESKEQLIRDESEFAIRSIEKYGGIIATVATVAPMLGLLGTVTGMMKSFSSLAKQGNSAQEMLAQGITEALITTAMGLLVAIPSMIFYNYMVSKVEFYIAEVEYIANSIAGISEDDN